MISDLTFNYFFKLFDIRRKWKFLDLFILGVVVWLSINVYLNYFYKVVPFIFLYILKNVAPYPISTKIHLLK